MQNIMSPSPTFSARIALAALVAGGIFTAPPAAAQDYRLSTVKAISSAVSGIPGAKAEPGSDQAGLTNPIKPEQAGRLEETPPEPDAGQKGPPGAPAQPPD